MRMAGVCSSHLRRMASCRSCTSLGDARESMFKSPPVAVLGVVPTGGSCMHDVLIISVMPPSCAAMCTRWGEVHRQHADHQPGGGDTTAWSRSNRLHVSHPTEHAAEQITRFHLLCCCTRLLRGRCCRAGCSGSCARLVAAGPRGSRTRCILVSASAWHAVLCC